MKALYWFAAVTALILAGLALYGALYTRGAEKRWPKEDGARIDPLYSTFRGAEGAAASGASITLLHGASANQREFSSNLAPRLERLGPLYLIDRPGLGHSPREQGDEKLAAQARKVAQTLDRRGAGQTILVAHSFGAAVALRVAIDHPERVRALVLLAPASHPYPGENAWHNRVAASGALGRVFCALAPAALGPLLVKSGVKETFSPASPPDNYYEEAGVGLIFRPKTFCANAADIVASKREFVEQAPLYPSLRMPVVIFSGETDEVVSPKLHSEALAREIPGAKLIWLKGAGHMPHHAAADDIALEIEALLLAEQSKGAAIGAGSVGK